MFWTEAAQSVRGAWRLALLDQAGMNGFNLSLQGLWRSFLVYLYLAPVYLVVILLPLQGTPIGDSIDPGTLLAAKLAAYVINIVASTLLLAVLCHLLAVGDGFIGLVVASNWSWVIQLAVALPLSFLSAKGLLASVAGGVLQSVLVVAMIFYSWFITRTALGVGVFTALGVVLAGELNNALVNLTVDWLFGIGAGPQPVL